MSSCLVLYHFKGENTIASRHSTLRRGGAARFDLFVGPTGVIPPRQTEFSAFASAQAVCGLQSPANHTGPTKNLRDSPPRLRSRVTARQQNFLLCNAASAKVRQGGAEIFCRSGGAGDGVVNCKRSVRKQKSKGLLTLLNPARGTGKKIGASSPDEPKRRVVADTVGQRRERGGFTEGTDCRFFRGRFWCACRARG